MSALVLEDTVELLKRIWTDDEGQDLVEYALLVSLLVLAAIVGMSALGDKIAAMWTYIAGQLKTS